ncbi:MAG: hypothetical protein ACXQTR_06705 [Candidatus Methanospirareceae archaeon]
MQNWGIILWASVFCYSKHPFYIDDAIEQAINPERWREEAEE